MYGTSLLLWSNKELENLNRRRRPLFAVECCLPSAWGVVVDFARLCPPPRNHQPSTVPYYYDENGGRSLTWRSRWAETATSAASPAAWRDTTVLIQLVMRSPSRHDDPFLLQRALLAAGPFSVVWFRQKEKKKRNGVSAKREREEGTRRTMAALGPIVRSLSDSNGPIQ